MSTTFQPPLKSLSARDYQFIALITVVFLAICTALVYVNLRLKGGGDFFVHWVGARAFLFDKIDPYSGEVPARVQQLVYGNSVKAGEEPFILDTPFQILPFYYPFALISNPIQARAMFTLALELALVSIAVLSLRLTDWKAPPFLTIPYFVFAVFNFYSFQAIQEANPVLILGLLYVGILLSHRADLDELTGALVAISLYYWEVGAPFLFLVFLRVYYEKRVRVLAGFVMMGFILIFISLLSYPDWIIPYMRAAVNNMRAEYGFSIQTVLTHLWPSSGRTLAWIIIILFIVLLVYEWSFARSGDFKRFYWASGLSLAITPFLGMRTEMENLVVLVIPLALIFAVVHDRWHRFGFGLTILLMFFIFTFPWVLSVFFAERFGAFSQEIIFLFLPISTIIGLYWIRWWVIRPPRVFNDLVNRK